MTGASASVVCALLLAARSADALCGDSFADGLDNLDGMMGSLPGFMVDPVNRICDEAATAAANSLPGDCHEIADRIRPIHECGPLAIILLNAATTGDCYCQAALLVAHSANKLQPSLVGELPAAASGGGFQVSALQMSVAAAFVLLTVRARPAPVTRSITLI